MKTKKIYNSNRISLLHDITDFIISEGFEVVSIVFNESDKIGPYQYEALIIYK